MSFVCLDGTVAVSTLPHSVTCIHPDVTASPEAFIQTPTEKWGKGVFQYIAAAWGKQSALVPPLLFWHEKPTLG